MTKRKNQFVNSRGEIIYTDSDIVPDGCGITTSMMLMDGLDDTQREIARSYSQPARVCDAIGRAAGAPPRFPADGHVERRVARRGHRRSRYCLC
jgi:hypothetical protein